MQRQSQDSSTVEGPGTTQIVVVRRLNQPKLGLRKKTVSSSQDLENDINSTFFYRN